MLKKTFAMTAVFGSALLFAAPDISVKLNKPSGIYKCGENITVTAQVVDNGKPVSGRVVKYEILADGGFRKAGTFTSDAKKPFTHTLKLAIPGMMRSEFILLDKNGKPIPVKKRRDQYVSISGRIGAVAEPEKIKPSFTVPAKFKTFWAEQRKKLDAIPVKELERKKIRNIYGVDVYDIKVACAGKRPVSAYLMIPGKAQKGKHPIMLTYHGAGVVSSRLGDGFKYARRGFVVLDVNAHGILNGQPQKYYQDLRKGELHDYSTTLNENILENYRLGMVLRLMRSLDYAKSLPEWNGKDLVVYGCSQGGYQALIAAGIDPQVSLCRAGVPAYSDFHGEFDSKVKRIPRMHINLWLRKLKKGAKYNQLILDNHIYFDPAAFAPQIKCPVYITCGACDLSCPPNSVYGIFNSIPKEFRADVKFYPEGIHSTSIEHDAAHKAIEKLCPKK